MSRSNTAGRRANTIGCRTLAADLVRRQVAVIVVPSSTLRRSRPRPRPRRFRSSSAVGDDPVKLGLVASLNRPGGNAHGRELVHR